MNRLHLFERLSIILIVFISMISCKKEPDNSRFEDADIRILKVQRISQAPKNFEGGLNPFFDILGLVEYEFNSSGLTNNIIYYCNIYKSPCYSYLPTPTKIKYDMSYVGNLISGYDVKIVLNGAGTIYLEPMNQVYKNVNIITKSGGVSSVNSFISWAPPQGPFLDGFINYKYDYPLRTAKNQYEYYCIVNSVNDDIYPERDRKISREILSNGQYGPVKFKEISTSLHAINSGNLSIEDNHVSEDLEFEIKFASVDGIPRKLVGLVNAALMGYMKTGLEDIASFTWEQSSAGLKTDMRTLEVDRADWMFLFAIAPYLSPMESDQIVSSISQKGTRFDIWTMQNTEVNKVETFPYFHDPVAKTLEIAGLKIWYEVVN